MTVANRVRVFSRKEMHGRHIVKHRNLAVKHRYIHMLANTATLALIECGQNAHHPKHATTEIADRDSRPHGVRGIGTSDRHSTTHGLRHLIKSGPFTAWTIRAEP